MVGLEAFVVEFTFDDLPEEADDFSSAIGFFEDYLGERALVAICCRCPWSFFSCQSLAYGNICSL